MTPACANPCTQVHRCAWGGGAGVKGVRLCAGGRWARTTARPNRLPTQQACRTAQACVSGRKAGYGESGLAKVALHICARTSVTAWGRKVVCVCEGGVRGMRGLGPDHFSHIHLGVPSRVCNTTCHTRHNHKSKFPWADARVCVDMPAPTPNRYTCMKVMQVSVPLLDEGVSGSGRRWAREETPAT